MRLVCPNCEAKYEVPEDAIPEGGRDVQCANCGHAWYQMRQQPAAAEPLPQATPPSLAPVVEAPAARTASRPETVAAAAEAPSDTASELPAEDQDAAVTTVGVVPAIEAAVVEPVVTEEALGASEAAEVDEPVPAAPAAYAVDDSVLAILREEAEREVKARRAEAARPLETQTDLGIEAAIPAARPVQSAAPASAPTPASAEATRRTRLPDVEEINSTLRPAETAGDDGLTDEGGAQGDGRSSFRSGFLLVLTVAILGSALYASADTLAEAVPALAGALKAYVGFVDSLRLQLDGLMQSATVAINGT